MDTEKSYTVTKPGGKSYTFRIISLEKAEKLIQLFEGQVSEEFISYRQKNRNIP